MSEITRREFIKQSSYAALGASALYASVTFAQSISKDPPPSERIVMGFIGMGGRGRHLLNWFKRHKDVEVAAVCDASRSRLEAAVKAAGGKAKGYRDFREVLDRKDIDAVVIATPPHWHALLTIYACQAGKDVYVEKPMCIYPAEAIAMRRAVERYKRVTQVGTQIHAGENYRRTVEIVRSGILGKIVTVRNVCMLNEAPNGIGWAQDANPPPDLDWDLWLGPAPYRPFNPLRFRLHRYFSDYVPSWLLELGPHIVDLPFWALNLEPPLTVYAAGGKFAIRDISDIPDTLEVIWEFPSFVMTWMHTAANSYGFTFQGSPGIRRRLGVIFHGVNGTLAASYGTRELISEGKRLEGVKLPEPSIPSSPGHEREFLDCIKTRKLPSCCVQYHYNVHIALTLAHVSLKLGRKLRWSEASQQVVGDDEANELCMPQYRKPWVLPMSV